MIRTSCILVLLLIVLAACTAAAEPGHVYLHFDGLHSYAEVPDDDAFSLAGHDGLTVSVWLRPDRLDFPTDHPDKYVHWLGKGTGHGKSGQQEWVFRWYRSDSIRPNRVSFYLFNLSGTAASNDCGGPGCGSYFEGVEPNRWLHVVGVADRERTYIYKDGELKDSDVYDRVIHPENGTAPLRIGTRDKETFLTGGLSLLRIWNRALSREDVALLHRSEMQDAELPADLRKQLAAEYPLNEGAGEVIHDTVGGRHGKLQGPTWAPAPAAAKGDAALAPAGDALGRAGAWR